MHAKMVTQLVPRLPCHENKFDVLEMINPEDISPKKNKIVLFTLALKLHNHHVKNYSPYPTRSYMSISFNIQLINSNSHPQTSPN